MKASRGRFAGGAVAVVCAVGVTGCTSSTRSSTPSSTPSTTTCESKKTTGELPTWARAGFTTGTANPYVLGDRGDIVAVLQGDPLHSPPQPGRTSKILWVARVGTGQAAASGVSANLEIEGRLAGSDLTVSHEVTGGPGPSIVDVPAPGCWNFRLSWSGHTDSLAIVYLAG